MAKCQVILTSLGIVAVTPSEKRIASKNDGLLLLALILALLVALFKIKKLFWVTMSLWHWWSLWYCQHSLQSREVN